MDFDFLTLGRDLGHCYGLDRSSLSPSGARLRLPVWLSSGYSTPSCSCSANAKRNPENMKMRTSLRNHRVLWAVLSTTIALGVAAVGSYFGFVVQNNDSDLVKLPNYAIGATKLMWTQGFIGQPDDFSSQLDRSDLVIEGVIDELYLARWSSVDGAAPDILPSYDWDKLVIDLRQAAGTLGLRRLPLPVTPAMGGDQAQVAGAVRRGGGDRREHAPQARLRQGAVPPSAKDSPRPGRQPR